LNFFFLKRDSNLPSNSCILKTLFNRKTSTSILEPASCFSLQSEREKFSEAKKRSSQGCWMRAIHQVDRWFLSLLPIGRAIKSGRGWVLRRSSCLSLWISLSDAPPQLAVLQLLSFNWLTTKHTVRILNLLRILIFLMNTITAI
jgi:hypothetical protein